MSDLLIRKLNLKDANELVYSLFQKIGRNENEFQNTANGLSFTEFGAWIKEQIDWANGIGLPEGFVKQNVYILYLESTPIGVGKIRHKLTDRSREKGGNIGYAISPDFRGHGYAVFLLKELVIQSNEMGVFERLLTVEKNNYASRKTVEKAGGQLIRENDERWFFEI